MSTYIEKRALIGGLSSDYSFEDMPDGMLLNASNLRAITSEQGDAQSLTPIAGTTLLYNTYLGTIHSCIGGCYDETNNMLVWMVFDTNTFDSDLSGIYARDLNTGTNYTVLLSNDVTGGLNFAVDQYIHSCFVENGLLYWVNSIWNQPRRINIKAAINFYHPGAYPTVAAYTGPVSADVIAWIRREPALPAQASKVVTGGLANNFTKEEAFLYSYRYTYRDFEVSAIADFSTLINYNLSTDSFNSVAVNIPLGEKIDQDVLKVELIALYLTGNTGFVIRTWDKRIPADLAAIVAHNAGSALTYLHLNDSLGTALDKATINKLFDSVPLFAESCAIGKDRSMMLNVVAGYNTPQTTSLTAVAVTINSGALTGDWVQVNFFSPISGPLGNHYYIHITGYGYYDVAPQPAPPPFPATFAFGSMTLVSIDDPGAFSAYVGTIAPGPIPPNEYFIFYNVGSVTITGGPAPPSAVGARVFKTDASYVVSILFKDRAGRRTGYLTNPSLLIPIPDRVYNQSSFVNTIIWTLNNTNAINEIPVDADTYSINLSKCRRTRSFLDMRGTKGASLVYKDASGVWTYGAPPTVGTPINSAWDITSLLQYNMGYIFEAGSGDIMKIYLNDGNPPHFLAIVAQDGNWLITELFVPGGGLSSATAFLFEIYTPYAPSASEPNYQVANISHVINPGTNTRRYGVLTGAIQGDVTLLQRFDGTNNYLVEAMSPNDKLYKNWNTDSGKPTFIDPLGQVVKKNFIAFSNPFIEGTQVNGLSTYDALDTTSIFQECGPGRKLVLTSKVQGEQGSVLLAICERETVSIYLGETQQYGSAEASTITISTGVIGTKNVLKGSRGTLNPESVVQYRGLVFWLDVSSGGPIQYSDNGLELIARFHMLTFWKTWCDKYMTLSPRPYVFGGIDPFNGDFLLSLPQLELTNPNGLLPGTAAQNLFIIYDGQAKTMAYKIDANKWQPTHPYVAETFIYAANKLFGFSSAALYLHNDPSATYGKFYGVQYDHKIMCVCNISPNVPKIAAAINVEATQTPKTAYIYVTYPNIQCTDLDDTLFNDIEGIFYAPVYRDRNSPAYQPDTDAAWLSGDKIRGATAMVEVDFAGGANFRVRFINVTEDVSIGHKTVNHPQREFNK